MNLVYESPSTNVQEIICSPESKTMCAFLTPDVPIIITPATPSLFVCVWFFVLTLAILYWIDGIIQENTK